MAIRPDTGSRARRDVHTEDERLRGRSRPGDHDRSLPDRRARAAIPQAGAARGQRRSRAMDAARRRRHGVQSPGGAPGPDRTGVHAGAVSLRSRDVGRHTQRPGAETPVFIRPRSPERHTAAGVDDVTGVRAASERAGPQPVPPAVAGGAAADRGPRCRHRRHTHPARRDGLRSPVDRRPGRTDCSR